jgi:hypothetical protein
MDGASGVSCDAVGIVSIRSSKCTAIGNISLFIRDIIHSDSGVAEVVVVPAQVSHGSCSGHIASSAWVIYRHSICRVTFQMNCRGIDHLSLMVSVLLDR